MGAVTLPPPLTFVGLLRDDIVATHERDEKMGNTWILGAIVFVVSVFTCLSGFAIKLLPIVRQYLHQAMNGGHIFDARAIAAMGFLDLCTFLLLTLTAIVVFAGLSEIKSKGQ